MYIAHIHPNGKTQTVREHCRQAASYASRVLKAIGMEKTAFLAALLHDMGKCKDEFSEYISAGTARRGSVNHTFCGVRFVLESYRKRLPTLFRQRKGMPDPGGKRHLPAVYTECFLNRQASVRA